MQKPDRKLWVIALAPGALVVIALLLYSRIAPPSARRWSLYLAIMIFIGLIQTIARLFLYKYAARLPAAPKKAPASFAFVVFGLILVMACVFLALGVLLGRNHIILLFIACIIVLFVVYSTIMALAAKAGISRFRVRQWVWSLPWVRLATGNFRPHGEKLEEHSPR